MSYCYDTDVIELERVKRAWSKGQLAEKAGITLNTYSSFIRGKFKNPRTAKKIAEVLGLKLADLVVRQEEAA